MKPKNTSIFSKIKTSLKLEIICYAIGCLLFGVLCFALFNKFSNWLVSSYVEPINAETQINVATLEFQTYVTENGISSYEWEEIAGWSNTHNNMYILKMSKDNMFSQNRPLGEKEGRRIKLDTHNVPISVDIQYNDRTYHTEFLYISGRTAFVVGSSISAAVAFFVFFGAFYLLLRKKLDYILEIEQGISVIESGDLSHKITVQGEDELRLLADSVNSMSQSLMEKTLSEQQAVESGRQIIGDLSHDIRTPLTILAGYIPILLDDDSLTENQQKYLLLVDKKTKQMGKRVDELLDYSTIYSGQQQINRVMLSVQSIVSQFKEELATMNAVITDTTSDNSLVYGDPKLLDRVFDNVISNLYRYANLENEIKLLCFEKNGNLNITVENFILPTAPVDGKSLGLKIAAYIMELHDGSFSYNQTNQNYSATICLPLKYGAKKG